MLEAYEHDAKRDNIILHLNPKLAPYKAAVLPIVKGEEYEALCGEVLANLRKEFNVLYDKSGSIGRRYARNDEAGTPYCITIDEDSIKKKKVTIRDRDSTKQITVKIADLRSTLRDLVNGDVVFENAGKLVETRVK
jgi:glycyl-tRNA synthetase